MHVIEFHEDDDELTRNLKLSMRIAQIAAELSGMAIAVESDEVRERLISAAERVLAIVAPGTYR